MAEFQFRDLNEVLTEWGELERKYEEYMRLNYQSRKLSGGRPPKDAPHHVYHFVDRREGLHYPAYNYAGFYGVYPEDIDAVLKRLETAESEGRLSFRNGNYLRSLREVERFQNTLVALRKLGAEIPEWDPDSTHFDAFWNVPAMRRFLGGSVKYANDI